MASGAVHCVTFCLLSLAVLTTAQLNRHGHHQHQQQQQHQQQHQQQRQHQHQQQSQQQHQQMDANRQSFPGLNEHQRRQLSQQNQRHQTLPPHQQPTFDEDDGGQHRPASVSNHYCRLSMSHSLCRRQHTRTTCGYVKRRRLSFEEAAAILHRHNMERRMLAQGQIRGRNGAFLPRGADIMELEYDIELHDIAQGAADQCHSNHDCFDCRKTGDYHVGQNVASFGVMLDRRQFSREELKNINPRPVDQLGGWLGEVTHMDSNLINRFPGGTPAGHYTQMVWSRTHLLGCGWIEYEIHNGLQVRLYCNYGPGGNVVDQPVYRVGEPCSACPAGSRCSAEYPGLCRRDHPR